MDKELTKKLYEMVGAVKMAKMLGSFVDAARYSLYKQLRDSKAYKVLGKDWKDFCEDDLGRDQKTVNMEIKLLEEYGEPFLKAAERIGLSKRDLNALGSGLPEEAKADFKKGFIVIGDVKIKETEIDEHLDELKEAIGAVVKRAENAEKDRKAMERVNENLHKSLDKAHKEQERMEKRDILLKENPNMLEEDFATQLGGIRLNFEALMNTITPENMEILKDEDEEGNEKEHKPTVRMKAAYIELLGYMKKVILGTHGEAVARFGTAAMMPEEVWSPGKGASLKKIKE